MFMSLDKAEQNNNRKFLLRTVCEYNLSREWASGVAIQKELNIIVWIINENKINDFFDENCLI